MASSSSSRPMPTPTALFVYNVPADVDVNRLTKHFDQVVDRYVNEHPVEWKRQRPTVWSLSLHKPVELPSNEFHFDGHTLRAHLLPEELVESMTVSLSKQWTDKVKIPGLPEPGVKTVTNCGVVTLEGNKSGVLKSVEKIRDAIIDTMLKCDNGAHDTNICQYKQDTTRKCEITNKERHFGSNDNTDKRHLSQELAQDDSTRYKDCHVHSDIACVPDNDQRNTSDKIQRPQETLPEHETANGETAYCMDDDSESPDSVVNSSRSRDDNFPGQDDQVSDEKQQDDAHSLEENGDLKPLEDDEAEVMAYLEAWGRGGYASEISKSLVEPSASHNNYIVVNMNSAAVDECIVDGKGVTEKPSEIQNEPVKAGYSDSSQTSDESVREDDGTQNTSSGDKNTDETEVANVGNTDVYDIADTIPTNDNIPNRSEVARHEDHSDDLIDLFSDDEHLWKRDLTDKKEAAPLADNIGNPMNDRCQTTDIPDSIGTPSTADVPITTNFVANGGSNPNITAFASQSKHPISTAIDERYNVGDCLKPCLVTSQNMHSPTARWQIDEPLWEFIKFSHADDKWDSVLTEVDLHDGSGKVELSGNVEDVDRLKKFCGEGRLNRNVVTQMFQVPSGHSAEALKPLARQMGGTRVLVRSTNDRSYLELTGKGKDVQILVHEMEKMHPPSKSSDKPHPSNQDSVTAAVTTSGPSSNSASHDARQPARIAASDERFEFCTSKSRIHVTVLTGDILKQQCEVIVSPCNHMVDLSGGLARAIAEAAGPGLAIECKDFIRLYQFLYTSYLARTQAGNLPPPIRTVLHACGPNTSECPDISQCSYLLERTFFNCLMCANDVTRANSVALPAISAGNFGVALHVVASAACSAVMNFDNAMCARQPAGSSLKQITFVDRNRDATRHLVAKFRDTLVPQIPAKVVNVPSAPKRPAQRHMKTTVKNGDGAASDACSNTDSKSCADGTSSQHPNSDASNFDPQSPSSCPICMDDIDVARTLDCGHKFCAKCIDDAFAYQKKCPCCGKIFGELKGDQPNDGTMKVRKEQLDLDGYRGCGRIVIDYCIPSGIQQANHPNPGKSYAGARRTAYLPGNKEGHEVCSLLRRAFDAGLIFTVGRSTTSGRQDVVTWNDIHHKTKPSGPYGYPDPNYLSRVRDELAAKGITSSTSTA